jgi:hypothetical protein
VTVGDDVEDLAAERQSVGIDIGRGGDRGAAADHQRVRGHVELEQNRLAVAHLDERGAQLVDGDAKVLDLLQGEADGRRHAARHEPGQAHVPAVRRQ